MRRTAGTTSLIDVYIPWCWPAMDVMYEHQMNRGQTSQVYEENRTKGKAHVDRGTPFTVNSCRPRGKVISFYPSSCSRLDFRPGKSAIQLSLID